MTQSPDSGLRASLSPRPKNAVKRCPLLSSASKALLSITDNKRASSKIVSFLSTKSPFPPCVISRVKFRKLEKDSSFPKTVSEATHPYLIDAQWQCQLDAGFPQSEFMSLISYPTTCHDVAKGEGGSRSAPTPKRFHLRARALAEDVEAGSFIRSDVIGRLYPYG